MLQAEKVDDLEMFFFILLYFCEM